MKRLQKREPVSVRKAKQKRIEKRSRVHSKQVLKDYITYVEDEDNEQKRGLIFISHLPLGFYENELRRYFLQFGKVTNVQVCRSKRTGRSKCCGYVEFLLPEVAVIAADTINNYSMMQEKIKVQYIPYEERPKYLFNDNINHASLSKRNNLNTTRRSSLRKSTIQKSFPIVYNRATSPDCPPIDVRSIKEEKPSNLELQSHSVNNEKLSSKKPLTKNTKSQKIPPHSPNNNKLFERVEVSLSKVKSIGKSTLPKSSNMFHIRKKKRKQLKTGPTSTLTMKHFSADILKTIARELIRQRGNSLLSYPLPIKLK